MILTLIQTLLLTYQLADIWLRKILRPGDCKYQELIFKTEITDFFIFCQEKPFGEIFSKIGLKLAREFFILRNPAKRRIVVFALQPQ